MGYAKNKKAIVIGTSSCAPPHAAGVAMVRALFCVYKPPCMWLRTGRTEEFKPVRVETEFPAPGNESKHARPLSISPIKPSRNEIAIEIATCESDQIRPGFWKATIPGPVTAFYRGNSTYPHMHLLTTTPCASSALAPPAPCWQQRISHRLAFSRQRGKG